MEALCGLLTFLTFCLVLLGLRTLLHPSRATRAHANRDPRKRGGRASGIQLNRQKKMRVAKGKKEPHEPEPHFF